jgi:hypothetical protein
MNPVIDPHNMSESDLFDLLERPEEWPDDPVMQAKLADLLEMHLALHAHRTELEEPVRQQSNVRQFRSAWLMAAAAVMMAVVPSLYALYSFQHIRQVRQDQARIEGLAQKRGQARLWAAFFQQSSDLIQNFQNKPPVCSEDREDRSGERTLALALLSASHQLAAQGAPTPEAEAIRNDLHAWLREISLEDSCMDPDRSKELKQWAQTHNLEEEAKRLSELLVREGG